ncbi:MAG: flavin reductase [Gammaproteobacteria bacterium]|nr:flavin reductase [Gammaproteobacteria bacterium]
MRTMTRSELRQLRNAFGTFLTGVTVVTSRERNGIPRGFTANSFTSVSLDPPMLLICVDKSAESFDVFTRQPGFAVNILSENQVETASLFASKRADKFEVAQWSGSGTGNPVLAGGCAWFDCAREQVIDAGDHVILLGRILSYEYNDGLGLGYVRGGFMSLGMERSAANAAGRSSNVVVGAIVECKGKVLLFEDPHTRILHIPASGLRGSAGSLTRLQSELEKLEIKVNMGSLFAVFENEKTGQQSIYYRAKVDTDPARDEFWGFEAIPWDRIPPGPQTTMLRRYIDEAGRQRFGIYFGSDRDGEVETLR